MAISSSAVRGSSSIRLMPPMAPRVIGPDRQAAPPGDDAVDELVDGERDEDEDRDRAPDREAERTESPSTRGPYGASPTNTVIRASPGIQLRWTRISMPAIRAIAPGPVVVHRTASAAPTWISGSRAGRRTRPVARRRAPRPAGEAEQDDPQDDRGLRPELVREQLDEPLGARIEQVRAAREEDPVEDLEQGVEGDERDDPEDDDPDRQGDRPGPGGPPEPGGAARAPAGDEQASAERRTSDEEAGEHAPHVAHVGLLARIEHGLAAHGHREVAAEVQAAPRIASVARPKLVGACTRSRRSTPPGPARTRRTAG